MSMSQPISLSSSSFVAPSCHASLVPPPTSSRQDGTHRMLEGGITRTEGVDRKATAHIAAQQQMYETQHTSSTQHNTPHHIIHITMPHITSHHITSHHITSHHNTTWHGMAWHRIAQSMGCMIPSRMYMCRVPHVATPNTHNCIGSVHIPSHYMSSHAISRGTHACRSCPWLCVNMAMQRVMGSDGCRVT